LIKGVEGLPNPTTIKL